MAFQKGHKKFGGRKKSVKIKPLKVNETAAERMAPALAELVGDSEQGPTQERAGIEPKSLLLDSMRGAWDAAHKKARQAADLEALAKELPEDSEGRKALESKAAVLRAESGTLVGQAQELATKVAPYMHPRLANLDNKVSGDITIIQKKYGLDGSPMPEPVSAKVSTHSE